jgi:hypothetical protein
MDWRIKRNGINTKRIALMAGLAFIGLALLLNEWTVKTLFSSDGVIAPRTAAIVWGFDLLTVAVGLVLVVSRSFARLIDLFVGLGITALMIFGAEKLFQRLNNPPLPVVPTEAPAPAPPPIHYEGSYTQDFFRPDELLGSRPRPGAVVSSTKKQGDAVIYDVVYTIDEHQRRVTPVDDPAGRDKFILFFGGSFTFGEGVNDDETLPYHVGRLAPYYRPYNYGLSGYGPQQMLAMLQSGLLDEAVAETDGMVIYTFIDAHVERAIGSMYVYNAWGDQMPYYALDRRGNLVRRGNFTTGRPMLSAIYGWLEHSEIAKYFNVNIPGELRDRHYAHAARIMAEARDTFQETYNSDQFYVVIYPDEGDYFEDMEVHLKAAGLKVLNYDERMKIEKDPDLSIIGDGHPTGNAHQIVAGWIVDDTGIGAGAQK